VSVFDLSSWTMLRDTYGPADAEAGEKVISRLLNIWRYRIVRKYCYGTVVDAACGCGAGSWAVSINPDVRQVIGIDSDLNAISFAESEVNGDRQRHPNESPLRFVVGDLSTLDMSVFKPDVVVSVETIEHLPDPCAWILALTMSGARRIVLSYPSYKTTHFNKHHLHDITLEQVKGWLLSTGYEVVKRIDIADEVDVLIIERAA